MLKKIVSDGQTAADRAALDFAIKRNIPRDGWIPKGKKAEDGPLAERYHLRETPTVDKAAQRLRVWITGTVSMYSKWLAWRQVSHADALRDLCVQSVPLTPTDVVAPSVSCL